MDRITIVGLGLIGGSIGLALKAAKLHSVEVVGHDVTRSALGDAKKRGAVDRTEGSLREALKGADLVVLAVPVLAIREVLQDAAPLLKEGAVVTDTGSTKALVMEWARELLPPHISFVGGHPLAGKETPGIEAAEATLFRGAVYALCPSPSAEADAVKVVVWLVENILGSRPFFVDPHEHDGLVAGISHLPIILSSALVSCTTQSPSWREMSKLAANGYRDISRLAAGDPTMNRDICLSNRESLARWIDACINEMQAYRRLILEEGPGLGERFNKVWEERARWMLEREGKVKEQGLDIPSAGDRITSLFFGEWVTKRTRQMMEGPPRPAEPKK
ncbi:MAG: prephenate dehydrogenase/arogenate dehydrogenase family protein [Chloroflexi bacterium]|nr:prephenate dehydrogenase/arogenate dehydrogenase family protein [Chloroflexota bacterium]